MKLIRVLSLLNITAAVIGANAQAPPQNVPPLDPATSSSRLYNMGEAPAKDEATTATKQHYLNVQLFSIIPEEGIESFRGTPAPGAMITGVGGMTGPAYSDVDKTLFGVQVSPTMNNGRYGAQVKVTPWGSNGGLIKAQTLSVDLSDMKTTSIELARNSKGRIYLVSLTPAVEVSTTAPPKSIRKAADDLADFKFENSAVILNDDEFLGSMTGYGTGAQKAFLDIPGKFKVEFALVPFRDAEISGQMEDGVLNIRKDGEQVTVYNVMSRLGGLLPDGPYEVWARWNPPSETKEAAIANNLAFLEQQRSEGSTAFTEAFIDEAIKKLKAGKATMTHGLGGIATTDRVKDE